MGPVRAFFKKTNIWLVLWLGLSLAFIGSSLMEPPPAHAIGGACVSPPVPFPFPGSCPLGEECDSISLSCLPSPSPSPTGCPILEDLDGNMTCGTPSTSLGAAVSPTTDSITVAWRTCCAAKSNYACYASNYISAFPCVIGTPGCVSCYHQRPWNMSASLPRNLSGIKSTSGGCYAYKQTYTNAALYGCFSPIATAAEIGVLNNGGTYSDPWTGVGLGPLAVPSSVPTPTGSSCSCQGHYTYDGYAACDSRCIAGGLSAGTFAHSNPMGGSDWLLDTRTKPSVAPSGSGAGSNTVQGYTGSSTSPTRTFKCPVGQAMQGISNGGGSDASPTGVWSGGDLDSIAVVCNDVPGSGSSYGATTTQLATDGTGSTLRAGYLCPTGKFVYKITYRYNTGSDDQVNQFTFRCASIGDRTGTLDSVPPSGWGSSSDSGSASFTCPAGTFITSGSVYASNEPSWFKFICTSPASPITP